jgi:hypothetical protein
MADVSRIVSEAARKATGGEKRRMDEMGFIYSSLPEGDGRLPAGPKESRQLGSTQARDGGTGPPP